MHKPENFLRGYLVCALWSTNGDNGEPLDRSFDLEDIAPETRAKMAADCERFQRDNASLLELYAERKRVDPQWGTVEDYAGHDFWLSRNGHGSGFFDRDDVDRTTRDALQLAARAYKETDLYAGDDGLLYI